MKWFRFLIVAIGFCFLFSCASSSSSQVRLNKGDYLIQLAGSDYFVIHTIKNWQMFQDVTRMPEDIRLQHAMLTKVGINLKLFGYISKRFAGIRVLVEEAGIATSYYYKLITTFDADGIKEIKHYESYRLKDGTEAVIWSYTMSGNSNRYLELVINSGLSDVRITFWTDEKDYQYYEPFFYNSLKKMKVDRKR